MESQQNCEEMEIDLSQYIKVLVKRKKTFFGVFLLILAIGLGYILFSPRIYRISMMIQPPVNGMALTGASDLESAENLKGLIINNVFNEDLKKRLNFDFDKNVIGFKVEIPNKTNILQVSVDLESKKKGFGVVLLRNLIDLISNSYVKLIEVSTNDIANQIKQNEFAIENAKERSINLSDQIKEITVRDDKLKEEIKSVNVNIAQMIAKREKMLKDNATTDSVSTLLLSNYLQSSLSYSNQVNNQLSDLVIRRANLNLEIKNIEVQIRDFQMAIGTLKENIVFVSNLKVLSQPRVSFSPISPSRKEVLAISIVMGLFLGVFTIFLQEFWVNNLMKK